MRRRGVNGDEVCVVRVWGVGRARAVRPGRWAPGWWAPALGAWARFWQVGWWWACPWALDMGSACAGCGCPTALPRWHCCWVAGRTSGSACLITRSTGIPGPLQLHSSLWHNHHHRQPGSLAALQQQQPLASEQPHLMCEPLNSPCEGNQISSLKTCGARVQGVWACRVRVQGVWACRVRVQGVRACSGRLGTRSWRHGSRAGSGSSRAGSLGRTRQAAQACGQRTAWSQAFSFMRRAVMRSMSAMVRVLGRM